jgi:RimJ/RimL family protein N-acetyltransferase
MELTLTRSLLRPWRPGDESSLVRHANNRNVWRNLRDLFPSPYTLADARRWIGHAATRPADTAFAVVVEDEAVGGIDFRLGEDVFLGTAEVGYWLGETFWGRGIMTEAVRVLTAHAFARLALRRVEADVFAWNPASARVLEKAGYRLEGRFRNCVLKDGAVTDRLVYARLREDP